MLRRKHRVSNLKQEREKIARYLQSFLSRVRDPERREPGKGDDAATESVAISGPTRKGAVEDAKSKALAKASATVAIGLAAFDAPGPSRIQSSKNKSNRSSRNTTRDKSTQMRKNLSTQSLRANEQVYDDDDNDDDSDPRNEHQRPKYILIGWDSFRSKLMLLLMVLFLLWIAIYFPLIGS
ncbi:uncharacterized protein LOC143209559 [Lasioglossum baleicum]|uniref:uncharacterized protein LOC143209559 n=1 Tax=Lasioglossum baleicum TaxID=434251 RepID=UPI003FCC8486